MLFSDWVNTQKDTRAHVAARIGVSRDALYKIMRGQVLPRRTTRLAIDRETGGQVRVDDLLTALNAYHAAHATVTSAPTS